MVNIHCWIGSTSMIYRLISTFLKKTDVKNNLSPHLNIEILYKKINLSYCVLILLIV